VETRVVEVLEDVGRGKRLSPMVCGCGERVPTYPTYRERYHVEPCPYAYIRELATALQTLTRVVEKLENRDRQLGRAIIDLSHAVEMGDAP